MAVKSAPSFEESTEMMEIVKALISQRADIFPNIDVNLILCGVRTDKEAPTQQKTVLKIDGIRGHRTLLSEKRYIIYGYQSMWDELSEEKKVAHIANMLKCIEAPTPEEIAELMVEGENFEHGKLKKPDIVDWRTFINNLSIDWSDEEVSIPNIIKDTTVKI